MGGFKRQGFAKIFFLLIVVCSFASAVTTTTDSAFSDYFPEDDELLLGYCTGTESGSSDLFYEYKLFRNDSLYSEGYTPNTITTPDPYYTGQTGSWQMIGNAFDNNTVTFSSVQSSSFRYLLANYTNTGDEFAKLRALYSFFGNDNINIRFQCYNGTNYETIYTETYKSSTQNNSWLIPPQCNDGVGDIALRIGSRSNSGSAQFQLYELDVDFFDATKYSSGQQVNVVNISNTTTQVGDEWTLSCKAQFDSEEGNFLNSSVATVLEICSANWSCTNYGACINNSQSCTGVVDLNFCGDAYTGNYSEFTPQYCFGYQNQYDKDDISEVTVDVIFAFMKALVALAGLIALFFLFKRAKVWVIEK